MLECLNPKATIRLSGEMKLLVGERCFKLARMIFHLRFHAYDTEVGRILYIFSGHTDFCTTKSSVLTTLVTFETPGVIWNMQNGGSVGRGSFELFHSCTCTAPVSLCI